ncbi:hypothetical protein KZ810_00380 [Sphingomonas sp. RHCKR47]|uniref:hypothetical protein n=1 Tax=Sphingomonas citricola TaxID=2862498 RepID=UPI001CA530E5|nr:hypothetical protein [Sphingomonas citricola]MBW6521942.1 hypothetical protein [Sphingomonas citricola]
MTPAIAALIGGALSTGYAPVLRRQVCDGIVSIPIGGIRPFEIRRDTAPRAFRVAVAVMTASVTALVIGCAILLVGALRR